MPEVKEPIIVYLPKGGREIIVTQNEWDEERDMSNVAGPADADLWSSAGERDDGESRGEIMEKIGVGFARVGAGSRERNVARVSAVAAHLGAKKRLQFLGAVNSTGEAPPINPEIDRRP